MFESDAVVEVLGYFRVPYVVRGGETPTLSRRTRRTRRLVVDGELGGQARSVLWPASSGRRAHGQWAGWFRGIGTSTLPGHVVTAPPSDALGDLGGRWRVRDTLTDLSGRAIAAVWEDASGNTFLPFDPDEVVRLWWSEGYARLTSRGALTRAARALAVRAYYTARPALPRPLQLSLRRAHAHRLRHDLPPAWPVEMSLHEFYAWYFDLLADLAGEPVPSIAPWPDGHQWAMVLTHDVETAAGVDDIDLLRADERRLGYRSSWNFVGGRYRVPEDVVSDLADEGCEVGVHGLMHDGKDLASSRRLRQRLPAMHAWAREWDAVGFRSPATQRSWTLMARLGFDYDASYSDTDPYEPQPGGCGSYLPFMIGNVVELPITLPQDHTLYEILDHRDGRLWVDKTQTLRERGGMALVLAHPDYARKPAISSAWRELLEAYAFDTTKWQPLPREAAQWWRDRGHSRVVASSDGRWTVAGPAASRATVELLGSGRAERRSPARRPTGLAQ
jgi:hypothetical protein